ncbi:MAG: FHA domain-containing protein [Burkholderiales bacterium]|nr:FHA domain-containing protein [Burkholderiales bacterium]
MAKLILTLDGVMLKEYTLTKERTTIGRKAHNDIPIDNLAVSGEHAAIVTILNDSFLEDLGSTNGTLVNGQPIKKHFLQNSDVIEIGKYKLKYVNEAPSTTTAADFEKTMVLRAPPKAPAEPKLGDTQTNLTTTSGVKTALSDTQINPQLGMAAETAAAAAEMRAQQVVAPATITPVAPVAAGGQQGVIQILSGPNAGKELPLTKALTTLGKPGVQVAVIAKRPQGYFITHVEGASFPVVNGKALDPQAHQLNDHDVIELAGVKMEFFFRAA